MLYPDQRAKVKEQTRYRVRIPKRERTRDGLLAILADSSTDVGGSGLQREGGELRSKGPTVGKEKPGITFCLRETWEGL
ncbi:hypothetical protein C5S39_08685 [Candidatus Methanophagaceae archaeon]|nr:hypothetical protein C5S39_08685 [Methanophagales archaeon]